MLPTRTLKATGCALKKSVIWQKLIFLLSAGSLLFYLVTFDSESKNSMLTGQADQCHKGLHRIRSGKPIALKKQLKVTPKNVLTLTQSEQRLLTHYIHLTGITLVKHGNSNPMLMTSYKMEGSARQVVGYKVVIDAENERDDVLTYYINPKGSLLFWAWDSYQPVQEWTCEGFSRPTNTIAWSSPLF